MRCVFVLHAPRDPHGAVYADTVRRAKALQGRGHEVQILTPGDLPLTSGMLPRWLPFVYPIRAALWLLCASRHADVAIFHSYTGWFLCVLRTCWPRARRTRLVTHFHGLEPLHYRALAEEHARMGQPFRLRTRLMQGLVVPAMARLSCRGSDNVVCLNRSEEQFLARNRWCPEDRIFRTSNAVEPGLIGAEPPRPRVQRLLFLGQWLPGKGTRYLARAFTRLATTHEDLDLCCLGTRLPEDEVRADFPRQVAGRVDVVPTADRLRIVEELGRADLFLFPSLAEGFSLALLEAMAAGLPIVATRVGAAPELLEDGISALLVEPANAPALADGVERLIGDHDLRRRLGAAARERAASHTWDRITSAYVGLIEALSADPREGTTS